MSRPDIELTLDVRSHENVVVFMNPDATHEYPENWLQALSFDDIALISEDTVVIVDRIDLYPKMISAIGSKRPRLFALVPKSVEQEKTMRRMLSAVYPWSEVWTLSSSFGKLLVTKDAVGEAYDRELIRDERPYAEA